ncbi:MAG TPA: hypothetical protein DCQ12_03440 [Candidatus Cloacimonas sp.]|nr:hypothetical protein [Candidatus Cloacimonas sp.]
MSRYIITTIILLLLAGVLMAQPAQAESGVTPEEAEELSLEAIVAAISDSLMQQREQEVREEFGFGPRDRLADVAEILEVQNVAKWKSYLKLDPANEALDSITLSNLGITPYQAVLAEQFSIHGFTELSYFSEISERESVPIKKLRELVGLSSLDKRQDNTSLQVLGVDPAHLDSLITEFHEESVPYGLSLTLVGMLIVFSALLVTSIVVSQLRIVNKKPKTEEMPMVIDQKGKLVAERKTQDRNEVAAAIMALHMYETGIKERRKMMLTIKRTPTNQWRTSQVLEMPNRELFRFRR